MKLHQLNLTREQLSALNRAVEIAQQYDEKQIASLSYFEGHVAKSLLKDYMEYGRTATELLKIIKTALTQG